MSNDATNELKDTYDAPVDLLLHKVITDLENALRESDKLLEERNDEVKQLRSELEEVTVSQRELKQRNDYLTDLLSLNASKLNNIEVTTNGWQLEIENLREETDDLKARLHDTLTIKKQLTHQVEEYSQSCCALMKEMTTIRAEMDNTTESLQRQTVNTDILKQTLFDFFINHNIADKDSIDLLLKYCDYNQENCKILRKKLPAVRKFLKSTNN